MNKTGEKCPDSSAGLWNCGSAAPGNAERMAVAFGAGTGGLHSAEN
jgi:electron-transferring-flavoprotein dehydrogenase